MDFENKNLLVTFVLIAVLIVFAKSFHSFVSEDFEQTISAAPVIEVQSSYELQEEYEAEGISEEEVEEDSDIITTEELVIDSEGKAVWKEKRYNKWTFEEVADNQKSDSAEDLRDKVYQLEKKVKILEHKRYGSLTESEL